MKNQSAIHNSQTVMDARGISVNIPKNPRRIVSLVCSITETLFALGLERRIVGRTNYCVRPAPRVESVNKIGGPKNPDVDAILQLTPDLVIANIEENEEKDIRLLEVDGVPVFVTYPRTVMESLELIRTLGLITGSFEEAESWHQKAEQAVQETIHNSISLSQSPSIVCLIWRKPYMTVNRDTYVSDIITLSGGTNVFRDKSERYPTITLEDIIAAHPDIILLPSEPFPFQERHARELKKYCDIPAVRNNKVLLLDGEMITWYGIRMIYGLSYMRKIFTNYVRDLHPV